MVIFCYKYPQRPFPSADLVHTNRHRSTSKPEYELLDTSIFNDDRYFDGFVEYVKAGPRDIWIKIRAENRGPEAAPIHLMPTLWFRNTWSWPEAQDQRRPLIKGLKGLNHQTVMAEHPLLETDYLAAPTGGH